MIFISVLLGLMDFSDIVILCIRLNSCCQQTNKAKFVERISSLKKKIRSPKQKILDDPYVKDTLRRLHDDFVLVPAHKAANNVIVVCKKYHIETLIKELGINTTDMSPNSIYIPSTDSFDEILKSHCKFIESVGLEMSEEDKSLP